MGNETNLLWAWSRQHYASNVIKPTGRQIQTLGKPMKLVMIKTSATK